MTSQTQLDAQLSAYLADGPAEFPSEWRDAIAVAAEETAQRRPSTDWRAILDRRWPRLAVVVVLIGLLAALAMPLVGRLQVEPQPQPRTGPVVEPPRQPTPGPAVVQPAPTTLHGTWDALREPYPVPLRAEPPGGADIVAGDAWLDPLDDGDPRQDARVDLRHIRFSQSRSLGCLRADQLCVRFAPAQFLEEPLPEPQAEWISYGIVVDRDGDGSVDGQFGIDNIPGGCVRAWFTEPFTGDTEFVLGSRPNRPDCGSYDGAYGESNTPVAGCENFMGCGYMWISPGLAGSIDNRHGNFYLWAALIRDGQLVSVDYAPDVGWLSAPEDR